MHHAEILPPPHRVVQPRVLEMELLTDSQLRRVFVILPKGELGSSLLADPCKSVGNTRSPRPRGAASSPATRAASRTG